MTTKTLNITFDEKDFANLTRVKEQSMIDDDVSSWEEFILLKKKKKSI